MFKRLQCRFKGHKMVCDQIITINPDGTGEVDHNHQCLNCGNAKTFETEPLETEIVQMITGMMQGKQPTRADFDPGPKPHRGYLN